MSSTSSMPTLMRTSSGSTPAACQRLLGELAVRGRAGVDDQRARVADVGQVRAQLDAADERLARLAPALAARRRTRRPGPCGRYFCASAWLGSSGSPA